MVQRWCVQVCGYPALLSCFYSLVAEAEATRVTAVGSNRDAFTDRVALRSLMDNDYYSIDAILAENQVGLQLASHTPY